jgi:hypothetical protein
VSVVSVSISEEGDEYIKLDESVTQERMTGLDGCLIRHWGCMAIMRNSRGKLIRPSSAVCEIAKFEKVEIIYRNLNDPGLERVHEGDGRPGRDFLDDYWNYCVLKLVEKGIISTSATTKEERCVG